MAELPTLYSPSPVSSEPLDVLIVDDDLDITRLMTLYLSKFGYAVAPAHDGGMALKILRQRRVALVVTDILMPQVDGYELIMKLRQMPGRPQIIATSGNPARFGMNFLKSAQQMGADRLLAKPFLPGDMLAVVKELIGPRTIAA
jgi:CheY-like chemotaxis protein